MARQTKVRSLKNSTGRKKLRLFSINGKKLMYTSCPVMCFSMSDLFQEFVTTKARVINLDDLHERRFQLLVAFFSFYSLLSNNGGHAFKNKKERRKWDKGWIKWD